MTKTNPTVAVLVAITAGCAGARYQDKKMDFAAVKTVAVLPLVNLSRETTAAERVRDVFSNMLLATGALYVLPPGEVNRGLTRANVANPAAPSVEEVIALGKALGVEAVFTGAVKEYGEVRAGSSAANTISMSMEMIEAQTGKVVWSASTTKGGIGWSDRLFGGGGEPMNKVTEDAVRDLLNRLFK